MSKAIREKARELLAAGTVKMVVGYEESGNGTVRPAFARDPAGAERFVYNDRCLHNLALYLKKKEVKRLGRIGLVAPLHVMRSVLQIASEKQVQEKDLLVLGLSEKGEVVEFSSFSAIAGHVASQKIEIPAKDAEILSKLKAMSPEERLDYWTKELSRCFKCYACRASCPMCYCPRCQVEYNLPQIITVEPTPLGNLEWHFMRAMHLAGRCVNCGECGRACPLGIPVHLLTFSTIDTVKGHFDAPPAGTDAEMKPVMSSFKPDDKEDFFK